MHAHRVTKCQQGLPLDYYWYRGWRCGPGQPPKQVQEFMESEEVTDEHENMVDVMRKNIGCSL